MIGLVLVLGLVVIVSAIRMDKDLAGYGTIGADYNKYSIQVGEGWNLVRGLPDPNWLEGNQKIRAIYGFHPMDKEYVRFYPNAEEDKIGGSNFAWSDYLRFGAFWVYFDNPSNNLEYWTTNPASLEYTPLFSGWNFMAFTPEMSGKTFNEIKGNCIIEDAYLWSYGNQEWSDEASPKKKASNLDKPIDDDFEEYGFIIKVSSDCILGTSSGDGTSPPSIPN